PDAFASDLEMPPDLLERARVTVSQPEAQFQNLALAFVQAGEHIGELIPEQAEARRLGRAFGGLVFDEIAKAALLGLAGRSLEGDRLLSHLQGRADAPDGELH